MARANPLRSPTLHSVWGLISGFWGIIFARLFNGFKTKRQNRLKEKAFLLLFPTLFGIYSQNDHGEGQNDYGEGMTTGEREGNDYGRGA